MIGLNNKQDIHILSELYKLFKNQKKISSQQSFQYWNRIKSLGFKNYYKEYWKNYFSKNLSSYNFVTTSSSDPVNFSKIEKYSLNLDAYRLVFVNGFFSQELSDKNIGLWDFKIEAGINRTILPEPIQEDFFLYLTESLHQEITYFRIKKHKIPLKPLYLLHISQGSNKKENLTNLYCRHHIEFMSESIGQIIEHFVSFNNKIYFNNVRTSISIEGNSQLNYIKLISENNNSYHFSNNDIHINHSSVFKGSIFIIKSGLTRHHTNIKLNKQRTNFFLNSLSLSSKKNIHDIRTYLEHNNSFCSSYQLHKSIVSLCGYSMFNGLIKINKKITNSNSNMINKNLLLDNLSIVHTKPQLEIYSDDVQCSHGATVGFVDENQIFYLQSRGISYKNSKKMLVYAFAHEIFEKIDDNTIRDIIRINIENSLYEMV